MNTTITKREPASGGGACAGRYAQIEMNYLTQRTKDIAAHYFPVDAGWAIDQLQSFCESLAKYISEETTPESYERFCLAVLKIGKTSKDKFTQAIELGSCDYRDLLVAAGFANSVTIHNDWAQKIIEIQA